MSDLRDVASLPPKLQQFIKRLSIATNPQYDWEVPPQDQAQLANPVELNNQEIVFSNAMIELSGAIIATRRELLATKKAFREKTRLVAEFEMQVLRAAGSLSSADRNSKQLQQAFIERKIGENAAINGPYWVAREAAEKLEDAIADLEGELDNCDQLIRVVKHASENVQTHLSFVKMEWNRR